MAKKNKINFFAKYNSNTEKLKDLRIYIVLITIIVFGCLLTLNLINIKRMTDLNKEINTITTDILAKDRMDNIKRYRTWVDGTSLLNNYYDEVKIISDEIDKGEIINYSFFEKINESIPYGVKIVKMSVELESLEILGEGTKPSEIADFQNNLEKINYIDDVHIKIIQDLENNMSFSLTCSLKGGQ